MFHFLPPLQVLIDTTWDFFSFHSSIEEVEFINPDAHSKLLRYFEWWSASHERSAAAEASFGQGG